MLVQEETDGTGSVLNAGLHLGPDWTLSYKPDIYGNNIQLENQDPQMEEPQGPYLDSPLPKRIP